MISAQVTTFAWNGNNGEPGLQQYTSKACTRNSATTRHPSKAISLSAGRATVAAMSATGHTALHPTIRKKRTW